MDYLGFPAFGNSLLEIENNLEKGGKIPLDFGACNAVTYNINEIVVILCF